MQSGTMIQNITFSFHSRSSTTAWFGFLALYSSGIILNTFVIGVIAWKWKERKVHHAISLNLGVIYGLMCLVVLTLELVAENITLLQKMIFLFIVLVLCHSASNLILILTLQNLLRITRPFMVQINITRKSTECIVQLQWLLLTIVYCPIVILIFVLNEEAILYVLSMILDLVYIILLITAAVMFLMDLSIGILLCKQCFMKEEEESLNSTRSLPTTVAATTTATPPTTTTATTTTTSTTTTATTTTTTTTNSTTTAITQLNETEKSVLKYCILLNLFYGLLYIPSLHTFKTLDATFLVKITPPSWAIVSALLFLWENTVKF